MHLSESGFKLVYIMKTYIENAHPEAHVIGFGYIIGGFAEPSWDKNLLSLPIMMMNDEILKIEGKQDMAATFKWSCTTRDKMGTSATSLMSCVCMFIEYG